MHVRPRASVCVRIVGLIALAGCGGGGTTPPQAAPIAVATTSLPACVPIDKPFLAAKVRNFASSCAISTTGDVACWGPLRGPCSEPPGSTPQRLTQLAHIRDLASSIDELCASDGVSSTKCFGYQSHTWLPRFGPSSELATSDDSMCARLVDGNVMCEREGETWQVANVTRATSLSCDGYTCCAVAGGGRVACWGDAARKLGYDGHDWRSAALVHEPVPTAEMIRISRDDACVRTRAGGAYCWGNDRVKVLDRETGVRALYVDYGLCVIGNDGKTACTSDTPFIGPALDHVVDADGVCAAHADGHISCRGADRDGELGGGLPLRYATPTRVRTLGEVHELVMDNRTACAIGTTKVTCWGTHPRTVLVMPPGERVTEPDALLCARNDNRSLACLRGKYDVFPFERGNDDAFTFAPYVPPQGDPTDVSDPPPDEWSECYIDAQDRIRCGYLTLVDDVPSAARSLLRVETGYCAALRDGRVGCVQPSFAHQSKTFELVDGPRDVVQLVGWRHVCARSKDGKLWCWWRSKDGPPGDDCQAHQVQLEPASDVAAARDAARACAVVAGAVWCWDTGKAAVKTDAPFVAERVAVAKDATCALDDHGQVWCWGSDRNGLIGQGRVVQSNVPVRVTGIGR
jgi:alpha-tubulin suppressor-like RCC1 family protein